jgi:hypothetical protein
LYNFLFDEDETFRGAFKAIKDLIGFGGGTGVGLGPEMSDATVLDSTPRKVEAASGMRCSHDEIRSQFTDCDQKTFILILAEGYRDGPSFPTLRIFTVTFPI